MYYRFLFDNIFNPLKDYYHKKGLKFKPKNLYKYLVYVENLEESDNGFLHHIIPRSTAYDSNDLGLLEESGIEFGDYWNWIDTKVNLKSLSLEDHIKAHKYLYLMFPEHEGFLQAYLVFERYHLVENSEIKDKTSFLVNSLHSERAKNSKIKKYGSVTGMLHTKEAIHKAKETRLRKYGSPMGKAHCVDRSEVARKSAETMVNRYGFVFSKESNENSIATRREKYGTTFVNANTPEARQKAKITCLNKYGDSLGPCHSKESRAKIAKTRGRKIVKLNKAGIIVSIYNSVKEACRVEKIPYTLARKVDKNEIYAGYFWKTVEKDEFKFINPNNGNSRVFESWADCLMLAKIPYVPFSAIDNPINYIITNRSR